MDEPVVTSDVIRLECGHIFLTNSEDESIECPLCDAIQAVAEREEIEFQGEPPEQADLVDLVSADQSEELSDGRVQ